MVTKLALEFKGNRNYLHGTDMYNKISQEVGRWQAEGSATDLDISFYGLATSALVIAPLGEMDKALLRAVYAYSTMDRRLKLGAYETGEPVSGRYPYPEDEIVKDMSFDSNLLTGTLVGSSENYTDIEIWVAMVKAMHQQLLPDVTGKWLFARGQFPKYVRCGAVGKRQTILAANMGNKLTRTKLLQDGKEVGTIYFANA